MLSATCPCRKPHLCPKPPRIRAELLIPSDPIASWARGQRMSERWRARQRQLEDMLFGVQARRAGK